jgi:hypothetical protein
MILELADIRIQPGQQAAFDEAIVSARHVPPSSPRPRASSRSTRASSRPSATSCKSSGTPWKTTPWPSAKDRCSPSGAPLWAPSLPPRWSSTSSWWPSRRNSVDMQKGPKGPFFCGLRVEAPLSVQPPCVQPGRFPPGGSWRDHCPSRCRQSAMDRQPELATSRHPHDPAGPAGPLPLLAHEAIQAAATRESRI